MSGPVLSEIRTPRPVQTNNAMSWVCPEFQEKYPNLFELMSRDRVDGVKRKLTKLSVFSNRGILKACVNCPQEKVYAYVEPVDFRDLWKSIEDHLISGEVDWRPAE